MRVGDLAKLDCELGRIADLRSHLLAVARGRSVLNVGAAGGVDYYLPNRIDEWIHAKLADVADELVGIDIDREGIAHAAECGWRIAEANCEDMRLDRCFDVILLIDVIEHVADPGRALNNLVTHLTPGGAIYVSTPNPSYLGDIVRTMLGRGPSVYWDHVACFAPEHLQVLCDRHGHHLTGVYFFTHRDLRSTSLRLRSSFIATIGRLNPRLNNAWLGVVQLAG